MLLSGRVGLITPRLLSAPSSCLWTGNRSNGWPWRSSPFLQCISKREEACRSSCECGCTGVSFVKVFEKRQRTGGMYKPQWNQDSRNKSFFCFSLVIIDDETTKLSALRLLCSALIWLHLTTFYLDVICNIMHRNESKYIICQTLLAITKQWTDAACWCHI